MNAAIVMDKSGRLVLPKKVRERLHLRPGARLDARVVGDKLELTEAVDEAAIEIMPDGLPAIVGGKDLTPRRRSGNPAKSNWKDWRGHQAMISSIDTSILVAAMVAGESHHESCRKLVVTGGIGMYSHGITETFSTMTGGRKAFRLRAATVSSLLAGHFIPKLQMISLSDVEILSALGECEERGVRGGAIFDYLHLVAARRTGARCLYTLNMSNFLAFHRKGDPRIMHP